MTVHIDLVLELHELVDRLRTSWGWLELLVEPGPERGVVRPASDEQAERLVAQAFRERAYKLWNARLGRYALPPASTPVRLEVVDAWLSVDRMVRELAELERDRLVRARLRDRTGWDLLGWLDGTIAIGPLVAGSDGLWWTGGLGAAPEEDLREAQDALLQADRVARDAARVEGESLWPVPVRCPACRARSLQLHYESPDPRQWSVRCARSSCKCSGEGCGCLQAVRYHGRRHSWAYGELKGPYGLAIATAVADVLQRQADEEAGVDRAVRSGAQGHGGWPGREG